MTAMIHLPPDRSARWRCSECGGVCYYPQPTRGDRKTRMPYLWCPYCLRRIVKLEEARTDAAG